jgi:hypothetical protein
MITPTNIKADEEAAVPLIGYHDGVQLSLITKSGNSRQKFTYSH